MGKRSFEGERRMEGKGRRGMMVMRGLEDMEGWTSDSGECEYGIASIVMYEAIRQGLEERYIP